MLRIVLRVVKTLYYGRRGRAIESFVLQIVLRVVKTFVLPKEFCHRLEIPFRTVKNVLLVT